MKTLLYTLLLVSWASVAQAQMKDRYSERPGSAEPAAAQVEKLTRAMSKKLQLNEAQIIQLRAVNKIKLARLEEIQWQYQDDLTQRNARLMELEAQYEQECSRIFTPSQLSLFHEEKQRDAVPAPPPANSDGGLG